jgi:hypothetical protein
VADFGLALSNAHLQLFSGAERTKANQFILAPEVRREPLPLPRVPAKSLWEVFERADMWSAALMWCSELAASDQTAVQQLRDLCCHVARAYDNAQLAAWIRRHLVEANRCHALLATIIFNMMQAAPAERLTASDCVCMSGVVCFLPELAGANVADEERIDQALARARLQSANQLHQWLERCQAEQQTLEQRQQQIRAVIQLQFALTFDAPQVAEAIARLHQLHATLMANAAAQQ